MNNNNNNNSKYQQQNKTKQMHDYFNSDINNITIKKTDSSSYSDKGYRKQDQDYLMKSYDKNKLKTSLTNNNNNKQQQMNMNKQQSRVDTLSRILSKKITVTGGGIQQNKSLSIIGGNSNITYPNNSNNNLNKSIKNNNINNQIYQPPLPPLSSQQNNQKTNRLTITNQSISIINKNIQEQFQFSQLNYINQNNHNIENQNNHTYYDSIYNQEQKIPDQLTIQEKIIQNQLRTIHPQYQTLLIRQKQLQLQFIQEKAIQKQNKNILKKQRIPIQKILEDIKKAQDTLNQKKKYLEQFYRHLENKLKGNNGVPISLFNKLGQLQKILNQRYINQVKNLQDHLSQLKIAHQQYQEKIKILSEERDKANKKFQQQNSQNKSTNQIKNQQQKIQKNKELKKRYDQFKKLSNQMQKEQQHKKLLEADQRILKKLINIQEQHKKHGLIIESGIKRQFKIRLKDLRYKDMVGQQYQQKIPQLLKFIQQRAIQKHKKIMEIKKKNQLFQDLQAKFNSLLIAYSLIQTQQLSNRKSIQQKQGK